MMKEQVEENELEVWRDHADDYVQGLHWTNDTNWLCVPTSSGQLLLVNTYEGVITHKIQAHPNGILSSDISTFSDRMATGGQDGLVKIWDVKSGSFVRELKGGALWTEHVKWSPNGQYLATASGRFLNIWSVDGDLILSAGDHESTISAVSWRSDSETIATTCYGSVRFFSISKKINYETLFWQNSMISLAWSNDQKFIVAGTQDARVHFWPLPYLAEQDLEMSGYPGKVKNLAWDFKSSLLATESFNQIVVWKFNGKAPVGQTPLMLEGHEGKVTSLRFQHKEDLLISGDNKGNVLFWIPSITHMALAGANTKSEVTATSWSPDDSQVAIGTREGEILILDSPA
jgi:WD40 repeat protein